MRAVDLEKLQRDFDAKLSPPALSETIPRDPIGFLVRFLPFELSPAWRAYVSAFYGLALDEPTANALEQITGFREPVAGGYAEALAVTGRRGGKSSVEAVLGLYEAIVRGPEHMAFLAPGQYGYCIIVSRTNRQGLETFRYARAVVERNPELISLLEREPTESQSGGELRFRSGVVLTVLPSSKGSVRGFTVLSAILDEYAWLATDEQSADQDEEIAAAIRYAMLAPTGAPPRRISIISSPAGKLGLVYDLFQRHRGNPAAPVLVAHGSTPIWNPSIDPTSTASMRARDPKRYAREVLAEFSDVVSGWIEAAALDKVTVGRSSTPLEPVSGAHYFGAVDLAFKRDSSVLVIGHVEPVCRWAGCRAAKLSDGWHCAKHAEEWVRVTTRTKIITLDGVEQGAVETNKAPPLQFIVDAFWRWQPSPGAPLDAGHVVAQIVGRLHYYGIHRVTGDQFAARAMETLFARHGITFVEKPATNASKLAAFTPLREAIYSGEISLPPDEVALRELRELQETSTPGGFIHIGHADRATAHDDHAMALAWLHSVAREGAQQSAAPIRTTDAWKDF